MKTIVITLPEFYTGEAEAIVRQLDLGADRVHIRKPGASAAGMSALLGAIPRAYRSRLSLHDCTELAAEAGVGGVHLNSRNPHTPAGWTGLVSRSCHTLEELADAEADYCFLSPIFDSISKPGYRSAFTPEALRGADLSRAFALGGVSGGRLAEVEALGFAGAAMLGAAWSPVNLDHFRLQFITHDNGRVGTAEGARLALDGGCRWVQLRMKGAGADEILRAADQIRPLCRAAGATFILDDHVELVRRAGADGVHVGKNDMPVDEARRLLGPGFIIGATANTAADIRCAHAAGADSIGLGPFRFTTTKERLSPVLGAEGYRRILADCRREGITLPVVAIGGITATDIPEIMATGVSGIAVSGTILNSDNPIKTTETICKILS